MPQEILNKRLNHYWGRHIELVPPLNVPGSVGLGKTDLEGVGGDRER